MIKILFQRSKCIGCNYCSEAAPERWQMSKRDGKSVLIGGREKRGVIQVSVGNHEAEANRRAARLCPVKIIEIVEG